MQISFYCSSWKLFFCCGVVAFLLVIDHLRRPVEPASAVNDDRTSTPQLTLPGLQSDA